MSSFGYRFPDTEAEQEIPKRITVNIKVPNWDISIPSDAELAEILASQLRPAYQNWIELVHWNYPNYQPFNVSS
jgi:hypothetical protein